MRSSGIFECDEVFAESRTAGLVVSLSGAVGGGARRFGCLSRGQSHIHRRGLETCPADRRQTFLPTTIHTCPLRNTFYRRHRRPAKNTHTHTHTKQTGGLRVHGHPTRCDRRTEKNNNNDNNNNNNNNNSAAKTAAGRGRNFNNQIRRARPSAAALKRRHEPVSLAHR